MWVVTAYYSVGTPYEQEVKRLIPSLQRFNLPYFVQPVPKFRNWYLGVQYKPTFLQQMLQQFAGKSVIYVDADAEFLQYPSLFDELDQRPDVHIGVHMLDHGKRGRPTAGFEMLSGTIYLKNDAIVHQIVNAWIQRCAVGGQLWDQIALEAAIGSTPFYILPEEYCTIFDYMSDVQQPIIKHYQASRRCKDVIGPSPEAQHTPVPADQLPRTLLGGTPPTPRQVVQGGLVRFHRTYRGFNTV